MVPPTSMWTGALNFVVGATLGIPAIGFLSIDDPSGWGLPGFTTGNMLTCKFLNYKSKLVFVFHNYKVLAVALLNVEHRICKVQI